MVSYSYWLSLPYDLKMKIVALMEVPRSRYVHVADNKVVDDGHTEEDLKSITVEKMQAYTGLEETDFYKLFDAMTDKLTRPIEPAVEQMEERIEEAKEIEKKIGRPKKVTQ